jgi:hypothetical protein
MPTEATEATEAYARRKMLLRKAIQSIAELPFSRSQLSLKSQRINRKIPQYFL